MSLIAHMLGLEPNGHLVVGLEDDTDGSVRVYLDHRWRGIHTHVKDAQAVERVRRAWASSYRSGHLFTTVPRDALCDCPEVTP